MGRISQYPLRLCIAAALVLVGCTGGDTQGDTQQDPAATSSGVIEGGVVRIGTTENIDSLNPFKAFGIAPFWVFDYIYPGLTMRDPEDPGAFVGDFAQDWSVSEDGLEWTFTTQDGAGWSDGTPFTAEDARWTLQTIIDFADGPAASLAEPLGGVESVEATDATTLTITYRQPIAGVLEDLAQVPILPKHVWEPLAAGDGKQLRSTPNLPGEEGLVSGGPFVLTEYRDKEIALFEPNPEYWGTQPVIDGFGVRYFANPDALVTSLVNGEIDVAQGLAPTAVATVEEAGMTLYTGPKLQFRYLSMNANPDLVEDRELLDPAVRTAVEHAVDRDAIVETAWVGHAEPGAGIITPAAGSFRNPDVEGLPYDIEEANRILDEAGYERGPDGIRLADGEPMSYDLVFPQSEVGAGERAFQIVKQGLEQVGIDVKQVRLDDAAAFEAIGAPDYTYMEYDFAMWYWAYGSPDFMLSVLRCNQYGVWSDTGYCDPAYDEMYAEQSRTVDEAERLDIVYAMQEKIAEDKPYVVLTYDEVIDAWSPEWDGFIESPFGVWASPQSLVEAHRVG